MKINSILTTLQQYDNNLTNIKKVVEATTRTRYILTFVNKYCDSLNYNIEVLFYTKDKCILFTGFTKIYNDQWNKVYIFENDLLLVKLLISLVEVKR